MSLFKILQRSSLYMKGWKERKFVLPLCCYLYLKKKKKVKKVKKVTLLFLLLPRVIKQSVKETLEPIVQITLPPDIKQAQYSYIIARCALSNSWICGKPKKKTNQNITGQHKDVSAWCSLANDMSGQVVWMCL